MKIADIEKKLFGEFTIENSKNLAEKLIIVKNDYQIDEEAEMSFKTFQIRELLKHENVVQLKKISRETKRGLCSKTYLINVGYELMENSLLKEIIKRKKSRTPFSELELTRLLYDIIEGYGAFERTKLSQNEVHVGLIGLIDDFVMKSKRAKVMERLSVSKNNRAGLINAITSDFDFYMDPFLFVNLFNNNMDAIKNIKNMEQLINKNACFFSGFVYS